MKNKMFLTYCFTTLFSIIANAGTMGAVANDSMAISPGFIFGVEGGVANIDSLSLNNDVKNQRLGTNILLAKSSAVNAFAGTVGVFVGYKFPIFTNIAFEPIVAYHYVAGTSTYNFISSSSNATTIYNDIIGTKSIFDIVDLTVQANYRLNNGVNFFVQPGVAIVMNKFTITNTTNSLYEGSGTNTSFRPEVAIGFGKMLTKHFNLFAKYNYIKGNDVNIAFASSSPDISTINLGLSFEA